MFHVVWFKRDLRIQDHLPLALACQAGHVLPLYVVEPQMWKGEDRSARQWDFLCESVQGLAEDLQTLGLPLLVRRAEMINVLEELLTQFGSFVLWSHEETGNMWTYERDLEVKKWATFHQIDWREYQNNCVVRRLQDRDHWDQLWQAHIAKGIVETPFAPQASNHDLVSDEMAHSCDLGLPDDPCPGRQTGGRREAMSLMGSFYGSRGLNYSRDLSSPLSAAQSCSRLSAHLSLGCLSLREVYLAARIYGHDRARGWGRSLRAFRSRLHWHCHFIQKLETSPEFEHQTVHPAYEGLRGSSDQSEKLRAWQTGQTGFPFIDACMRQLHHTGWINFRMRALLCAFATYHLWLDWRAVGLHLARQFVDYEPGIHWNQIHMQSGNTGINAIRIYNPVKQSRDQDPHGHYIRTWVPELAHVPDDYLHEPWLMSLERQQACGCKLGVDYPAPIVDHLAAARQAKQKIFLLRKSPGFRSTAEEIVTKHGSRKFKQRRPHRETPKKKAKSPSPQAEFNWDD